MSKEELLKYLIAEIDLIMHDKDYRFENANGTWYSRESCRDLTNEEVFEELRTELRQLADLEAKLAESEKQIKDAREAGNMAVDSWCKNRRKYEAQIAEMQNKSFILYSMLYETLEKQGCENVASQIDQMTGWTYDKEADWLKGNRNYDQLKQSQKQLAIEELEKLKDFFLEPYKDEEMDTDYIITKDAGEIADYILDQIKQLKEGK